MKITVEIAGKSYNVEAKGLSIAIPLQFQGPQPNTYHVPPATARAYEQDGWVGDVRRGGSCNFETYTLTPHCNGTHTECVGHIAAERISVHHQVRDSLLPARLISLAPRNAADSGDSYDPPLDPSDKVIDKAQLVEALAAVPPAFCKAIVLRTLPNDPAKMARDYMQETPAFFTREAMRYLHDTGVAHLLVDMPSVDRLFDEGKLSNHHIFWGFQKGDAPPEEALGKSITEMVFVPESAPDGNYLLNLQLAPFQSDAAPSRPLLHFLHPDF